MTNAEPSAVSLWVDWHFWVEVAKILVGVGLAVGAAALTWRQYIVSKEKFRLDLFEKREPIYVMVWTALTAAVNEWDDRFERIGLLNNATPAGAFLFGKEIGDYMVDLIRRLRDLETARRWLLDPQLSDAGRKSATTRIIALEESLRDDLASLQERFSPYLAFEHWGSSGR